MFIILLIILGVLTRIVPHLNQFTAMLAVSFIAGLYLRGWQAFVVTLLMMIISDLVLGFHDTMLFTWGSVILINVIGLLLSNKKNYATVFSGSILSAVLFFLITNFGAFLSLYPHTLDGLRECYILAIPFFRTTLVSTLAYSVVLYAACEHLEINKIGDSALFWKRAYKRTK